MHQKKYQRVQANAYLAAQAVGHQISKALSFAERIAKSCQEQQAKAAFSAKLVSTQKRRK